MDKIKVGIDFDSVLVDTMTNYCNLLERFTGFRLNQKDITAYDVTKFIPKQYHELANEIWKMPKLYNDIKPIQDSQEYIEKLYKDNNVELYVVTVADGEILYAKFRTILNLFPWIKPENIIFTHNKQMIDLDVLIDDNPDYLIGGKYYKILFNQPWNKDFEITVNKYITDRVNNWKEVCQWVRSLETWGYAI
jgi:5'(3')-deoxyribonucleotidase